MQAGMSVDTGDTDWKLALRGSGEKPKTKAGTQTCQQLVENVWGRLRWIMTVLFRRLIAIISRIARGKRIRINAVNCANFCKP